MSDETNESVDAQPEQDSASDTESTDTPTGRPGHEGHSFKRELREGAAKVAGFAIEVGSILGGQGGDAVQAEKDVAAAETEEFLDRIDGEG